MMRYHIRNETHFIEFPRNADGLRQAKEYRKNAPGFHRRKIREVLQLMPSLVQMATIIAIR